MSTQAVLFDAPGPTARRRHAVAGVLGVLVIAGLLALVVRGLADPDNNQFTAQKWAPFADPVSWTAYLLPGLLSTLRAAAIAIVLSLALGIALGSARLSPLRAVAVPAGVIVEFFRSVPVLVMMLFAYSFGIYVLGLTGTVLPLFGVVTGLTLYNMSVIAELVRSGVFGLPKGQREAGLATGMTGGQVLTIVLLPQAITAMLPSLISQLVVVLKDTALGYIIAYQDLSRSATTLASLYGNTIPTLIVTAALYIAINYSLGSLAGLVERRLRSGRRGSGTPVVTGPVGTGLPGSTGLPGPVPAGPSSVTVDAPSGRP